MAMAICPIIVYHCALMPDVECEIACSVKNTQKQLVRMSSTQKHEACSVTDILITGIYVFLFTPSQKL